MLVNTTKKLQSIDIIKASPKKNPTIDFRAIITSEVPIAFFISKLVNTTNARENDFKKTNTQSRP